MGTHRNITATKFPGQGKHLGAEVKVCYHYDSNEFQPGKVVRDDMESPFVMLIHLTASDRFVLATECQYSIL